ncbi:MAG TPA: hypothetical protein VNT42_04850, partial [Sphingomonas sp.]|nr:hypothetical protein [Sphingomonas sp.]
MKGVSFWLGCALLVQAETLPSQIAVSANDGKYVPADAPDTPRTADTISILRIDRGQAKVLATLHAPATLTGPPGSVAISPDGRLAIVTAGQVLGESGASVAGDIVTVIDLRRPREPRIVQTLHAGTNAAGVAINPAGTLALVANSGADSISAFTIAGGRLSAAGTIVLDPKSRPVDVQFVDGGTAYVVAQGANSLFRLAIDGAGVRLVTGGIAVGAQPYSLAINRRTHMAYVGNIGGRSPAPTPGPRPGSVSIVDLTTGRMVGQVDTGLTPEHVGLSPSGR